jgi:hypothetical protein
MDIPWQWGICASACTARQPLEALINEQRKSQLTVIA